MSKKYHVKYDVGTWDVADIQKGGLGGTDALFIASIMRNEDGWTSTAFISIDGETEEPMTGTEIFKVFACLANELSKRQDTPGWQQALAHQTFSAIEAIILLRKDK